MVVITGKPFIPEGGEKAGTKVDPASVGQKWGQG
jgi:hypothetical protein